LRVRKLSRLLPGKDVRLKRHPEVRRAPGDIDLLKLRGDEGRLGLRVPIVSRRLLGNFGTPVENLGNPITLGALASGTTEKDQ
jgi:hypothetical protein